MAVGGVTRSSCERCGQALQLTPLVWRCPCGGPLELDLPRLTGDVELEAEGFWRFLPWLPVRSAVSLGEPRTPLIGVEAEGGTALLKLEGLLPSGSFKDRGAAVLVSWLAEQGVARVVEDSSGNAAAALAAYCARAGISSELYVPSGASPEKVVQIEAYGARVVRVPGARRMATTAAVEAARDGVTYATHLWHPLFQAGTETFAFELWEQLGRRAPGAIVVPVGAGSLLLGAWRGFRRLVRSRLVDTVPRLFGIQAASCAPLARSALGSQGRAGKTSAVGPAEGIRVSSPPRAAAVVSAAVRSGGSVVSVPDDAIWAAHASLGRRGVYAEPTAAVAFAGYRALVAEGRIADAGTVVIAVTGLGLKTTSTVRAWRSSLSEAVA